MTQGSLKKQNQLEKLECAKVALPVFDYLFTVLLGLTLCFKYLRPKRMYGHNDLLVCFPKLADLVTNPTVIFQNL